MCARVRFFALIIRRSQNTRFLCRTRLRFFALMTHKSVTCAIFPNKPGVPLTEKNQVHVYIFLETGSANFLFSRTRVFYALRLCCVFPPPKFQISHRNFH